MLIFLSISLAIYINAVSSLIIVGLNSIKIFLSIITFLSLLSSIFSFYKKSLKEQNIYNKCIFN